MPRYFFHIDCEQETADTISAELPDIEQAQQYALGILDVILAERSDREGAKAWRVAIESDGGNTLKTIKSGMIASAHPPRR